MIEEETQADLIDPNLKEGGGDWEGGVSGDYTHIFIQYPPRYSVSFIAKRLKGRTSRIFRQEFPEHPIF